jgi:peptidoglycan-associated lipoprotein
MMKSMISVLALSIVITGCSHKVTKPDEAPGMTPEVKATMNNPNLKMVHFAFNKSVLTDKAKETLNQDAKALRQVASLNFQIQGFCDERGGVDYNLVLGKKRAAAVKNYLISQGIDSSRISIMSYGKADPIDTHKNEAAYAMNRRANFAMHFTESASL